MQVRIHLKIGKIHRHTNIIIDWSNTLPVYNICWSISPAALVRKVGGWRVRSVSDTIEIIHLNFFRHFFLFCQLPAGLYFSCCITEKSGRVEGVCRIRYYWEYSSDYVFGIFLILSTVFVWFVTVSIIFVNFLWSIFPLLHYWEKWEGGGCVPNPILLETRRNDQTTNYATTTPYCFKDSQSSYFLLILWSSIPEKR